VKLPGLEPERTTALGPRGEIAALLGPAVGRLWLLLGATGLLAGLGWRWNGSAPAPVALADGLGVALWLGALWLAPAWERLSRRQTQTAPPIRMLVLAWLAAAAVLLSLAPLGVLLAYDPQGKLAEGSPLGGEPFAVTVPYLLLRLLPLCAAPLLLGGTGLLSILRRLAGVRGGTALWLAAGLPLHLPLLTGTTPLGAVGAGALLRLAMAQVTSPELQFAERMFEPLWPWLLGTWGAALVLLALSMFGRSPRRQALPPLLLAVAGGTAASVLRTLLLAAHWVGDPGQLAPDAPLGAVFVFVATTAVLWLVLAPLQRPVEFVRELGTSLPWLVYAFAVVVLLDLPQRLGGTAQPAHYLLACAAGLLALLAGLSCAALILRGTAPATARPAGREWGAPDFRQPLACALLLAGLALPNISADLPLAVLPAAALSSAALVAEQHGLALGTSLSLAVCAGLALVALRGRRYRPPARAPHPARLPAA
jgi:hypothetical protein